MIKLLKYTVVALVLLPIGSCTKQSDVSPSVVSTNGGSVATATFIKIPDTNFEQALLDLNIDTDTKLNGQISIKDAQNTTSFNVSFKKIKDLTGIEGFTNLKQLMVGYNELITLDLSKNVSLVKLVCHYNKLTGKLDLKNLTKLTSVDALGNASLSTICVSDTSALNNNTNWKKDSAASYSVCQ